MAKTTQKQDDNKNSQVDRRWKIVTFESKIKACFPLVTDEKTDLGLLKLFFFFFFLVFSVKEEDYGKSIHMQ